MVGVYYHRDTVKMDDNFLFPSIFMSVDFVFVSARFPFFDVDFFDVLQFRG